MTGEVEITDHFQAVLFQYLGYPCIRCAVTGRDATWLFRCPQFDAEAVIADFNNPETTVILSGLIKALKSVDSFKAMARSSLDGQWRSEKYASRA